MGVLHEFERRLEGAVEGFFARVFRSGVQPIELAKALQRYAEDNQHVTADGVVVPNVFRVTVGTKDHERLAGFGESLPRELAEVVVRTAAERGWTLKGPVKARVDVSDDVRLGRYRLTGRVEVVDTPARAGSRPASRPGPPHAAAPARSEPPRDQRPGIDRTQVISSAPRATLQLVVRSGNSQGHRTPVTGKRLTIGRQSSCDMTIDDSTVSREHAALVKRGDAWWVIDLGSTNGTRVNGVQAAEQPIALGDRVQFGEAVVELVEA